MDEIKEIFDSLRARIKSPYFGYLFFFTLFLNWKAWFYLFFADVDIKARYFFFDTETTTGSLIYLPLGFAFLAVIISPWLRLLFIKIAKYPTTQRNILQAQAESEILEEKNRLDKLRAEAEEIQEEKIISQAERDAKVRNLDDESRESTQKELAELRNIIEEGRDSSDKQSAKISVSLRQNTNNKGYRFHIINTGSAIASNVNFTLLLDENKQSPLTSDYKEIFPIKELHPGDEVSVIAAISMGMGPKFDSVLTWIDPDGQEHKKASTVTF